jgi:hypothetical protein
MSHAFNAAKCQLVDKLPCHYAFGAFAPRVLMNSLTRFSAFLNAATTVATPVFCETPHL